MEEITHAKPTPAMTGKSVQSFLALYRVFKKRYEIAMTNMGVAARTT